MQRLVHFFHVVQHYIYSDHKAEALVGTASAGVTGYVKAREMDMATELLYRDINTAVMAIVAAVIGFFVTMGLKKVFKKDE